MGHNQLQNLVWELWELLMQWIDKIYRNAIIGRDIKVYKEDIETYKW